MVKYDCKSKAVSIELPQLALLIRTSLPTRVDICDEKPPATLKAARHIRAHVAARRGRRRFCEWRLDHKSPRSKVNPLSGDDEFRRMAWLWWYMAFWGLAVELVLCTTKQMILQKRVPMYATKKAVKAMRRSASCRLSVKVAPITSPRDQLVHAPMWTGYCSAVAAPDIAMVDTERDESGAEYCADSQNSAP